MNEITVRGIQRACYVAGVDVKNFFLTGYMWFGIVAMALVVGVIIAKRLIQFIVHKRSRGEEKWDAPGKVLIAQLKGILFRFVSAIQS
jgi:hypothetical protein